MGQLGGTNHAVRVGVGTIVLSGLDVLLLRRSPGHLFPGFWCPPGGRCEYGETPHDAAIREVGEEAGLVINPQHLVYAGYSTTRGAEDGLQWVTHVYTATLWSGKVHNAEPARHDQIRWFKLDALPDLVVPYFAAWVRQDPAMVRDAGRPAPIHRALVRKAAKRQV